MSLVLRKQVVGWVANDAVQTFQKNLNLLKTGVCPARLGFRSRFSDEAGGGGTVVFHAVQWGVFTWKPRLT